MAVRLLGLCASKSDAHFKLGTSLGILVLTNAIMGFGIEVSGSGFRVDPGFRFKVLLDLRGLWVWVWVFLLSERSMYTEVCRVLL